MVFDKTKPGNDMLLINFPAACRANWLAIEAGTEASLLIKNAKCAADMDLADTKLHQIETAGKVSGKAITELADTPSAAGVLPAANTKNQLAADSLDSTPQYLDLLINTDMFEISVTDFLELKDGGVESEKLESGSASPGNNKGYGTNSAGTKGFHDVVDLVTAQALTGVKTITLQLESRTSDPDSPGAFRIWGRSNV